VRVGRAAVCGGRRSAFQWAHNVRSGKETDITSYGAASAVSRVEPRETQVSPLGRLREQYHQLLLIDSHEEAGNLTARTAACYRVHVLRGGSIFGFPLDGANAAQFVKRWRQTERALWLAANKQRLSARTERARYLPGPSVRKRGSARASRRRRLRTASSRARAPGPKASDDDPPSVTDSRAATVRGLR
jgi:hypothetical protein